VYARADETGALKVDGGKVEVRYKPNDGRMYQARADNLNVVDGRPLPDDTCGTAEPVAKAAAGAEGAAKPKAASKAAAGAGAPVAAVPEGAVIVYADGACSGNPGPAGLGVVVMDGERRIEISEYLGQGTNNIAELTAVLRALEILDAARPAVIHTDSQYTIGILQKGWKAKANTELVATLKSAMAGRKGTRLVYVPGHAGVKWNERADALAREAVMTRKSRKAEVATKTA